MINRSKKRQKGSRLSFQKNEIKKINRQEVQNNKNRENFKEAYRTGPLSGKKEREVQKGKEEMGSSFKVRSKDYQKVFKSTLKW